MTSLKETSDVTVSAAEDERSVRIERKESKDLAELPPSGTSLHKRRRGEPPESLSVRSPQTPSDAEGSSPCTAGPSPPDEFWTLDGETPDPEALCESMLQRLKDQNDALSKRGKEVAQRTKDTVEALDQLEKLLELLDQFVTLKEQNARILRRLKDVNHLKRLHSAHKRIDYENEKLKSEYKEIELINEALDAEFECEYGQILFDSVMMGGRSMKRSGSKWKTHSRFGGSLLRKQRSRSAGGDESDAPPGTPLRRRSEGIFMKEMEKSKVSKWTRVKAAFRWEKAQWPAVAMGGAASAVAAGAMVGAVALAGSSPSTATLTNPEPRDSASLTPGSAISLTPNSSCEELRDTGIRKSIRDDSDSRYLHLPPQDDSSTSPSPNKLHKSAWGKMMKMRDIIQTHRESIKKKTNRGSKSSPDVVPKRRRSLSDGGDSDAPPALTLTIPSSEELESEPSHPVLRKQRSLELGAHPPQHRPPRASKWTKVKRAFLTSASASVPSSPNRHSAFFTDAGSGLIPMLFSIVIFIILVLLVLSVRYHRPELTVTTVLVESIWVRNCDMVCLKDEPRLPALELPAKTVKDEPTKPKDLVSLPETTVKLREIASERCSCGSCPCALLDNVHRKFYGGNPAQSRIEWSLSPADFYETLQDVYNSCLKLWNTKPRDLPQKRISFANEDQFSSCEDFTLKTRRRSFERLTNSLAIKESTQGDSTTDPPKKAALPKSDRSIVLGSSTEKTDDASTKPPTTHQTDYRLQCHTGPKISEPSSNQPTTTTIPPTPETPIVNLPAPKPEPYPVSTTQPSTTKPSTKAKKSSKPTHSFWPWKLFRRSSKGSKKLALEQAPVVLDTPGPVDIETPVLPQATTAAADSTGRGPWPVTCDKKNCICPICDGRNCLRGCAQKTKTEGLSSGCEASVVRDEIAKDYAALQTRLGREFSDRRGKLYAATRPVATEEQLSADFRKKLAEWQLKKGVKQPLPVPARQDLSEDFLRKWDEWKRMKETNSVPAWEEEAKPDEVLVQTSTGLFKFQGISRSFTRKLHEWEKSRGIAPEASTSALLRAARARTSTVPQSPLTRTQSDGSVAPSGTGSGRLHASSLSVNDADDFDSEYEREHSLDGVDDCDGPQSRGAVLVEVEDEEVCTAAPLVAVSPRHTPQKPIYTYGQAEARLLCETSSAVTGTAVLQPNGADTRSVKANESSGARPKIRDQTKHTDNKNRRKIIRQPSIEEDAMFIRKTIQEIERGSSSHFKEKEMTDSEAREKSTDREITVHKHYSPLLTRSNDKDRIVEAKDRDSFEESKDDFKVRDVEKTNGKKKSKSRARLEREQSKPSESDTEHEVDTVTVEIPRRRKRPRRASEKPRTPPTSLHSDSEGEVFVLKLKASEQRDHSPEVIVKTTRKIFSPVVRSGETIPRAVIPVNVEDLPEVRPSEHSHRSEARKKETKTEKVKQEKSTRSKSSGDLQETEEIKKRTRPPLPSSPSSQRKPQPKETAPSIRIMIQRYNKKINEEGTSPVSSGASSPAWRSPSTERRRPPDMPIGVNIRNNPFLEREVQKSASACQLSRRDPTSAEKRLTPIPSTSLEGVLKSHSANALHPEQSRVETPIQKNIEDSQETITGTASTDTIVPDLTKNLPDTASNAASLPVFSQISDTTLPSLSSYMSGNPGLFGRSISTVETPTFTEYDSSAAQLSERAAKIKAAREKFLSSTVPMRREGTSSASDLRPGDRSSRISCESDVAESHSSGNQESAALGRSASTGMVNVDREAWQRVAEGSRREGRSRSRFSLARLAAKLRRRDEGAVSRLCRQSLLVQLINKH